MLAMRDVRDELPMLRAPDALHVRHALGMLATRHVCGELPMKDELPLRRALDALQARNESGMLAMRCVRDAVPVWPLETTNRRHVRTTCAAQQERKQRLKLRHT